MKPMKEMESAAQKSSSLGQGSKLVPDFNGVAVARSSKFFRGFTYIKLKCPNRLRIGGVTDLHTHTCHTCNVYVVNKTLIILGQWATANLGLKC